MLGTQLCQGSDDVRSAVLGQRPWNDLQGLPDREVGQGLRALDRTSLVIECLCDGHLDSSTTWYEPWILDDVPGHPHGVVEVPLDLVEDVLAGATEDHRAGLWVLAVHDKGEVFVSNLLHFEEPRSRANVALLDFGSPVDDGSTGGPRDTVVVRLPEAADGSHPGPGQVNRGEVAQALLRHHEVRLELDNVLAHLLDPLLLGLQERGPVLLFGNLHVGLVLSLLVLHGAVHEQDSRLLDLPLHAARQHNILAEHHSLEHGAVLERTSGELLDLGVLLDVNLHLAIPEVLGHGEHRIQSELRDEGAKPVGELGADAALHEPEHLIPVLDLDREGQVVDGLNRVLQGLDVTPHDDRGVVLLLQEGHSGVKELSGEDDDRGGSVPDLLVLGSAELDHALGGWMGHVDLAQNGVPVVREHDATVRVQKHLKHASGTQGRPHDIRDRLCRGHVTQLGLPALLSLGVLLRIERRSGREPSGSGEKGGRPGGGGWPG
mmetsp:Transcript_3485/g.12225  ORF Transcript_3485/g.12225 Transcript_3485/m.12225 type:complete len:490 (+) Transcript_3485:1839-3308(+)